MRTTRRVYSSFLKRNHESTKARRHKSMDYFSCFRVFVVAFGVYRPAEQAAGGMLLRWALVGLFVVSVSAQTDTSRDALFAAIRRGAAVDVTRLLDNGVDANLVDAEGVPAVMAATLFADAQVVESLLAHGADPNRPGPAGTTALMWAVPNVEQARLLVARGANVNARSDTERPPLLAGAATPARRWAAAPSARQERGRSRSGPAGTTLAPVRSADVEVVRFLVEKGLDPNALSRGPARGICPLRSTDDRLPDDEGTWHEPDLLVTTGHLAHSRVVVPFDGVRANVNASTPAHGRTPLLTAVTSEAENAETLKLLDHGADPERRVRRRVSRRSTGRFTTATR